MDHRLVAEQTVVLVAIGLSVAEIMDSMAEKQDDFVDAVADDVDLDSNLLSEEDEQLCCWVVEVESNLTTQQQVCCFEVDYSLHLRAVDSNQTLVVAVAVVDYHNGVAAIHHVARVDSACAKQVGAAADFVAGVVVECTFQP